MNPGQYERYVDLGFAFEPHAVRVLTGRVVYSREPYGIPEPCVLVECCETGIRWHEPLELARQWEVAK